MSTPNRTLSQQQFQAKLAWGQLAETDIAAWLMSRGAKLLPAYDIEYDSGKGPRLFGKDFQAATPDFLIWRQGKSLWIEAKHKTVFTWRYTNARKGLSAERCWETGIDYHHWLDYGRIQQETGMPVWLLFLHRSDCPHPRDLQRGSPPQCPVGLFGKDIDSLSHEQSFSHIDPGTNRIKNNGRHGMIYWPLCSLDFIAELRDVVGEVE